MKDVSLTCQDELRREKVRGMDLNGIDYVEVSDDQLSLCIHFFGKVPYRIDKEMVRIEGGQRIRNIQVVEVKIDRPSDPELDDCLRVTVDKVGDYSTYTLCILERDEKGRRTDRPLERLDPRYACVDFSFKVACPSDLDCKIETICPTKEHKAPDINYLAKDYASFRQLILDRLALTIPDWQERHVPDLNIALVEVFAYVADYLSYYQDAVATEAYLDTARQRISVRRHARLMDYQMHEGCNARAWVCISTDQDVELDSNEIYFITSCAELERIGSGILRAADLENIPANHYEVFEPLMQDPSAQLQFYASHTDIHFYTWGDKECCLSLGATKATLIGELVESRSDTRKRQTRDVQSKGKTRDQSAPKLHLKKGDILIFEEVMGPKTGNRADANPAHRHVVRLTEVYAGLDRLYNDQAVVEIPIVEIEWAPEDALPFPLCISALLPAPACTVLEGISLAHGNVILVDHGRKVDEGLEPIVPTREQVGECQCKGSSVEMSYLPDKFRPSLKLRPITYSESISSFSACSTAGPTSTRLLQNPRVALPQIKLIGIPPVPGDLKPLFHLDELPGAQQANLFGDLENLAKRLHAPQTPEGFYLRDLLGPDTQKLLDAYDGSSLPEELRNILITERNGLLELWFPQLDLLESQSQDKHFVIETDNDERAYARFGDGVLGKVPEAGTQFKATYRVGNGPAGNVGAEKISRMVFRKNTIGGLNLHLRNPLPAQGGMPPESNASVKLFAPQAFRKELQRAIIPDDYAQLVMHDFKDTVQEAAAVLRWTGSWYEVQVGIDARETEKPTDAFLKTIDGCLYRYRRMGRDVKVIPAYFVPLDIEMIVCVLPLYLRGHVKAAVLDRFSDRLLTDGQRGFFHPDNLTIGGAVTMSAIVSAAQAVAGVKSVTVTKLERLYKGANHEIENGLLTLGAMEIAQLNNDPNFPEHGKLTLLMRGGR